MSDVFNLRRFTDAQEGIYPRALTEIQKGRKMSHWMWFVFPQVDGLAYSLTSNHYSIKSLDEARAYLEHPILGPRLRECVEALLVLEGRSASAIFGSPDDIKLRSSMTLFAAVSPEDSAFEKVLDKYFQGVQDSLTVQILRF